MSGPSDKAVGAACDAWEKDVEASMHQLIAAAHDPALGLDRSVCLRDVVEALNDWVREDLPENAGAVADFIEREFGGTEVEA